DMVNLTLRKVYQTYPSFEVYEDTYKPLIIMELWTTLHTCFEEKRQKYHPATPIFLKDYRHNSRFTILNCFLAVSAYQFIKRNHIVDGDMIIVELVHGDKQLCVFGYVQGLQIEELSRPQQIEGHSYAKLLR